MNSRIPAMTSLETEDYDSEGSLVFEYVEVKLKRSKSTERIGLTLCYDVDDTCVFIGAIEPNSLAARCRDIIEDDQILKVNGAEVNCREDAKKLFSVCGENISLLLARPQFCSNDDGFVEETTSFEYMERLSETPDEDELDIVGGGGVGSFRSKDDSGRVTSSDQRNSESSGHDTNSPDKGNTPPRKKPQLGSPRTRGSDDCNSLSPLRSRLPQTTGQSRLHASPLRCSSRSQPGQSSPARGHSSPSRTGRRSPSRGGHMDVSRYIVNRPAPRLLIPPPPPESVCGAEERVAEEEPFYEDIARIVPRMGVRATVNTGSTGTGGSGTNSSSPTPSLLPTTAGSRLSPAPTPPPTRVGAPPPNGDVTEYENVTPPSNEDEQSLKDLYTQFADVMYTNRANLEHTMILQQKLFEQQRLASNKRKGRLADDPPEVTPTTPRTTPTKKNVSSGSSPSSHDSKVNSGQNYEWVVKRRRDGSRYITRRQIKTIDTALTSKMTSVTSQRAARKAKLEAERAGCTTDDDADLKLRRYYPRRNRHQHGDKTKKSSRNRYALNTNNDISTIKEIQLNSDNPLFSVTTV